MDRKNLLIGNCLETIKTLPDNSIDSIVTDPPYEIGFMGKGWDNTGIAYNVELWSECLRVLKPGGHLAAFGATRSYHRMAVAIEDAGFEIRDSIHWTYGSGFPKSHNVSKAITALETTGGSAPKNLRQARQGSAYAPTGQEDYRKGRMYSSEIADDNSETVLTVNAKQWDGWGTALKPSHELIVIARKPLTGTVAGNVLEYGTGAMNIDGSRVGTSGGCADGGPSGNSKSVTAYGDGLNGRYSLPVQGLGRWPANTLLTHNADCGTTCTKECPVSALDGQADASRFFAQLNYDQAFDDPATWVQYVAKPSKRERNAGLDGLEVKPTPGVDSGRTDGSLGKMTEPRTNNHPTVKPIAIMTYLIKLLTPPGGTVLDPFLGSGTTAVAATLNGYKWVGCELTKDYLPIIEGRITHAEATVKAEKAKAAEKPTTLF